MQILETGWRPGRSGRRLSQALSWISTVGVAWLILAAPLWAQPPTEEKEEKTYVPSYMIIIFAVGLALLFICRTGKRTVSFRRDSNA